MQLVWAAGLGLHGSQWWALMGFFSRLFQPRADGLQAPSDWTRLPDSNASELVLFDYTDASGKTVKATKGAWSPTPTSYSYRWYRSGTAITGATKSSYKLKKADKGKKISVRVTVKRAGYTTRAVTSSSHKVH